MIRSARAALVLAGLIGATVLAGSGAAAPAPGDTPSPVCTPRTEPVPRGPLRLVRSAPAAGSGGRITDLTLASPALGRQTHVNLLLPRGYDAHRRYPVLYLLHGAAGSYRDWQTAGDVVRIVDEVSRQRRLPPFLVVMPDGGNFGFYSDWYGTDVDGHGEAVAPAWTTYHIGELIPWVDRHYPTVASRSGRAVAGLSMGGFGAMSYATRFPDLFAAAGSFSGAVNPDLGYPAGNAFVTGASGAFGEGGFDQCIWGDLATQQVRWRGNDPTYLAGNLAGTGTSLFVASGGGDATRPDGLQTDPVEESVYLMSRQLVGALDAARVPHTDDFYGPGTHAWQYWQADLRRFLPQLSAALVRGARPPSAFSYRSVQPAFSVWGWSFVAHRSVTELAYLTGVGRSGLTAVGSGRLDVLTAPLYVPGARYAVTTPAGVRVVRADRTGRLAFGLDLGPSHTRQQTDFSDTATASWARVAVRIARSAG